MMRKGSPQSRGLALGLVLLCIAGVLLLAVMPVHRAHSRLDQRLDTLRNSLVQYSLRQKDPKALERRLQAFERASHTSTAFWKGTNHARISADLLTRLKQLTKAADGELRSTQILKPDHTDPFDRVGVRADMEISPAGLQKLFHKLEYGAPYLFIDDVLIAGRMRTMKAPGPEKGQTLSWQKLILTVRFSVYGYMQEPAEG